MLESRGNRSSHTGSLAAWIQTGLGVGIVAFALTLGGDAVVALLVCGAALVAIGAFSVWSSTRQSAWRVSSSRPIVLPSPEGQRLLHRICSHIGYANYQEELYGRSLVTLRGLRTSAQILRTDLFELLEQAAYQFNRIDGLLQERANASDASLRALAPASRAAALECMAIVVNHAAWIDTFPENQVDHRKTILEKTARMQELADRLTGLTSTKPSLLETVAVRTLLDDVLDKISLEEAARTELRQDENRGAPL